MTVNDQNQLSPHDHNTPKVYVISGPSGAGKDSVIALLLPLVDVDTVVTMTTRRRRETEVDGVHYRFVTREDFEDRLANKELLESALVHENWYGVPADTVRASLAKGRSVLIKVDPQGAATIKQMVPDGIFIFIRPSSLDELKDRLIARGSESTEEMTVRLANAEHEMAEQVWFDHVVENRNGQIDQAVAYIRDIINAQK